VKKTDETKLDTELVHLFIEAHPGCTMADIARCGLYEPKRAADPEKAARDWAERRVIDLGRRVRVVAGSSRPYRYKVAQP
jgi:hypothetical protein